MIPTLAPGDRLLVDPRPVKVGSFRVGDVVVLKDPEDRARLLVKRVAARDDPPGTVRVQGDARSDSRDSRVFGPIPHGSLVGVVWYRYLPTDRRGRVGPETGDRFRNR